MMLLALLLLAAQNPLPYRPAGATIVAEPAALLLAGFDRDGDARVTRKECIDGAAALAKDWTNGIGYIAFADWAERYLGDRNVNPSALEVDRNGDGRITTTEFGDRIDAIFVRLDTDKDGALTRAELLSIRRSTFDDRPDRRNREQQQRR
jgi:Ca2+-binding EF-hand superfamily protein